MVTGCAVPLSARWPAPELVLSGAQLQQELATALPELCLPQPSRRPSGGLRHELVPAPASIDRPGRRAPAGRLLPFRTPRQPTVLGVPLPHRIDRIVVL